MPSLRGAWILLMGLLFAAASNADSTHGAASRAAHQDAVGSKLVETQAALRDLWLGHIFWVREVVTAKVARDSRATEVAEDRAVENAKHIAGAVEPFYGKAASEQLFNLLAGHYAAIQAHADATIAGRAGQAKQATSDLTSNASQIAKFLSDANPHLPRQALEALLTAHGAHHLQQNQQLNQGERANEARTWDAMRMHIYSISDALAQAIAMQFPEKFQ